MPTPDAAAQVTRTPLKEPPAERLEPAQEKPKDRLRASRRGPGGTTLFKAYKTSC